MARIVRRRAADEDLLDLFVLIGRYSARAAARFLTAVERDCELLATFPELGGACESEHPALTGLRLWYVRRFRKYLIVYRPLADGIEIVRVVHGARYLEALFEE